MEKKECFFCENLTDFLCVGITISGGGYDYYFCRNCLKKLNALEHLRSELTELFNKPLTSPRKLSKIPWSKIVKKWITEHNEKQFGVNDIYLSFPGVSKRDKGSIRQAVYEMVKKGKIKVLNSEHPFVYQAVQAFLV